MLTARRQADAHATDSIWNNLSCDLPLTEDMNFTRMLGRTFMIGVIVVVISSMVLVHADAPLVNESAVSLGRSTPLRALRLPVKHEQPPKCLPPDDHFGGKNYCWFILQDEPQTQVHSGMLIRSNTSHTGWYSTLELIVVAPKDSNPTDVGIWAEGHTFLKLLLPKGITVDLTFFVPQIGAVGGKDVGNDEKEIEFKVELTTIVNVPGMDALKSKGENFASASIYTSGGMNQIFADVTAQGRAGSFSSEITFYGEVWAVDLVHWHYDCNVEVILHGPNIDFNELLLVFSQEYSPQ